MNCNKCEFCANGVATACVTCDAPMCSFHSKRWRHGECEDCWTERCACQDCGTPNYTGAPLCYACSTKPDQQTDLCALAPCKVCNAHQVQTEPCYSCRALVCGSCMSNCADCKRRSCRTCTNTHGALRACGLCFTKDQAESDEEERFWRLAVRPPPLRCDKCLCAHRTLMHDNWGYRDYDEGYWTDDSVSDSESDDIQVHWPPQAYAHDDEDDTTSQCSTAA